MTLVVKNRDPLIVPPSVRRRAGFKGGHQLEFKVSRGTITIVRKRSAEEIEDEREVMDPKVQAVIREGYVEFVAGKARPIEELLSSRESRSQRAPRKRRSCDTV